MGDGGVACVSSSSQRIMERCTPYSNTLRSTLQFPDRSPETQALSEVNTELEKEENKPRLLSSASRVGKDDDRDREFTRNSRSNLNSTDQRKRSPRDEAEYRSRRHSCEQEENSRGNFASSSKSRRVSEDSRSPGYSRSYRDFRSSNYSRHRDQNPPSPNHSGRNHGRSPSLSEKNRSRNPSYADRNNARSPSHSDRYHDRQVRSPSHSERCHNRHPRFPGNSDRQYHNRVSRSPNHTDKLHERYARSPKRPIRHHDRHARSPSDMERRHDISVRSPSLSARSPRRLHHSDYKVTSRLSRRHGSPDRDSKRKCEERSPPSRGRDSNKSSSQHPGTSSGGGSALDGTLPHDHKEELKRNSSANLAEKPNSEDGAEETVSAVTEKLESMEEDMDICDSPPYIAPHPTGMNATNSFVGNWFYLDHLGFERGPSRLCDLKKTVDDGLMVSDHLIKHFQSDRWVTVENAVSPLVSPDLASIAPDYVTQLAKPPEAPGNGLAEAGEWEPPSASSECRHDTQEACELVMKDMDTPVEDLRIDDRVEELLKGHPLLPGREVDVIAEALFIKCDQLKDADPCISEGFGLWDAYGEWSRHVAKEGYCRGHESLPRDSPNRHDARLAAPIDKSLFAGKWSCHGGDWKRNDEAIHDRSLKRKVVLNDGYPLCQMPACAYPDPRLHRPEFHISHIRSLEIPSWAYSWHEETNNANCVFSEGQAANLDASSEGQAANFVFSNSSTSLHGAIDNSKVVKINDSEASRGIPINRVSKPLLPKIWKGLVLPIVRNNASMFKNNPSAIKDLRSKLHEANKLPGLRPGQAQSLQSTIYGSEKSSVEDEPHTNTQMHDSHGIGEGKTEENAMRSHILTIDELKLNTGEWYYLNGGGREQGPMSFSRLQALVSSGTLPNNSSVYRKRDKVWVPMKVATPDSGFPPKLSSDCFNMSGVHLHENQPTEHSLASASTFHTLHPQFIGYTRGRLHELVMKSYRSREFSSAISEVLDPWLNTKQPKKAVEKISSTNLGPLMCSSSHAQSGKQLRTIGGEGEGDNDDELDLSLEQGDEFNFDSMCKDVGFGQGSCYTPDDQNGNWGLLNTYILAKIFHFMRSDIKSLAFSAATCKHWNLAVKLYKGICRQVNVSQLGSDCTDSIFWNIMGGYKKEKIISIVLTGCTNISTGALDEALQLFPMISSIDIRGCNQFNEFTKKFPSFRWRRNCSSDGINGTEDSNRIQNLKQRSLVTGAFRGLDGYLDDERSRVPCSIHGLNFNGVRGRDSVHNIYRSKFKNSKSVGSRKFPSVFAGNACMKGSFTGKSMSLSARRYKRKENFLALGLKDIMRENTFDFFLPKVADIQERMHNGYYNLHGLQSVMDDISRMCRDAIKANTQSDSGDMTRIIRLFMKLVTESEDNSKPFDDSDQISRSSKDGPVSISTVSSKTKKKEFKGTSERRGFNKRNNSFGNGSVDFGDSASDREGRRRLSRLNKKSFDSDTETTDESDISERSKVRVDDTSSETDGEMDIHSDGERDNVRDENAAEYEMHDSTIEDREWGARMTKVSLVPPITRKYEVIDHYVVVADEEYVRRKMRVALPDDYAEKLAAQKEGVEESLEIPEVKDYKPRKKLEDEVLEQEVYGIDPYTHNLLLDSIPEELGWPLPEQCVFIEEVLLPALNKQVRCFTVTGNAPIEYRLKPVIEEINKNAEEGHNKRILEICQVLLKAIENRPEDNYVAYRKGLGVVCNKMEGFGEDDFVVEFLGEVYPAWKWFEKQDGIRFLQKNSKDPAPEFYNIYLERPKGDREGYDLVVVDAMHKANYASRICHSCRPNCEAKVTAVDGQYQIGIYTVRPVSYGEEITFDYNSVTESKEEHEASVCLCGSQVCRGSYLSLTGEEAFQKVMKECHGVLDRHKLMLEACELNSVSKEDYDVLNKAGLGSCLLSELPDWLIAYSAHLVKYINFEKTKLPEEILKHNLQEKRKIFSDISLEFEKSEAEVQAEGVYNQRLQNLAVTLDKVRYVLRSVFEDPRRAPPPLQRVTPHALISLLWKGEGSLVEELLMCMAPHLDEDVLEDLKSQIRAHDPIVSDDIKRELRKSLLWLRDELRNLPSSNKCRHDAAADLIHIYAYTNCFFTIKEYKSVTSQPVYISPLDLGPKYAHKMGSGFHEYRKTYGESYCLGQLIYWHNQTFADPDSHLAKARRGCLLLPNLSSFYSSIQQISRNRIYGQRTLRLMMSRMEKQPQRPWPKDEIWVFKKTQHLFGSPMMDAVLGNSTLDREMMQWLRTRPAVDQ